MRKGFLERLRQTGVPIDKAIVIGGGVLELHGIREARDIDLVVDTATFAQLERDGWKHGGQGSSSYCLEKGQAEVWADWSTDGSGHPDYHDLLEVSEPFDGVRAVKLDYLKKRKLERGTEKDLRDIEAIEKHKEETCHG